MAQAYRRMQLNHKTDSDNLSTHTQESSSKILDEKIALILHKPARRRKRQEEEEGGPGRR